MMVVDTSALMAVVLDEPEAPACIEALQASPGLMISAGTMAEALIVAARRGVQDEVASLIEGLGFEIEPVTAATARRVAAAYGVWGKGVHAASLNFGDCFAYELARTNDCPLLYVGGDFARTDVRAAI